MKTLKGFQVFSIVSIGCAALFLTREASAAGPIRNRKVRQQDRIAQGVKSGQLTAGETGRLERKEGSLNQEEGDMRKLDGGKLTAQDRKTINGQQNQLSRNIYEQKHDAQTQSKPTTEVGARKENQQDRISQGIQSGQLTAGEAARLEGKESAINRKTRIMREDNGGSLTAAEKARVNAQQNRVSGDIYRQKHDAQAQPQ